MPIRTYLSCLLLALFLMVPLTAANHERTHEIRYEAGQNFCTPPEEGDWEVPRNVVVVCAGQDVVVRGDILYNVGSELHVVDGANLTFEGPGLHVVRSVHGDSLLGGGAFSVRDARISGKDEAVWSLYAGAETRTLIQRAELLDYQEIVAGPLASGDAGFLLQESRLVDGGQVLVLASPEADVTITNNLFMGAQDALSLHGGGAVVENNTITSCNRAFVLTGNASPRLLNNTVSTCLQPLMQDPGPGACSQDAVLHGNDITAATMPSVGCLDAGGNYWGPLGPLEGGLMVEAWESRPVHPERLPRVTVSWSGEDENRLVSFDATRTRPSKEHASPIHLTWSFGDGATAEGEIVNHTYPQAGAYQVRLLVEDELGLAREWIETIQVGSTKDAGSFELQSVPDHAEDRASPGPGVALLVLLAVGAGVVRRRS